MNKKNIIDCIEIDRDAVFLDCGCDDGEWTSRIIKKGVFRVKNCYGIEIVDERARLAEKKGFKVVRTDLNKSLPFKDNFFDIVHINQVIEHLFDTHKFLNEVFRVTKKGGYIVISTENLASWHNIFSLLFGYQPFSLTNISQVYFGIGNPMTPHYKEKMSNPKSWQHIRVFAYRGLIEHIGEIGFEIEKVMGAGYYPLNFISKYDPRHSAFLTLKARKLRK
ncbi:MAG: hypothetical protein A2W22_03495 [Candidatus Levybacteria bacterium RBG_16_35_11]|nr:MAG: hypothetical protein A2W22_03495 [Candidatus Levybacteria bacterium RBG_16_35_11]